MGLPSALREVRQTCKVREALAGVPSPVEALSCPVADLGCGRRDSIVGVGAGGLVAVCGLGCGEGRARLKVVRQPLLPPLLVQLVASAGGVRG
jgi:hypothetical protein